MSSSRPKSWKNGERIYIWTPRLGFIWLSEYPPRFDEKKTNPDTEFPYFMNSTAW